MTIFDGAYAITRATRARARTNNDTNTYANPNTNP